MKCRDIYDAALKLIAELGDDNITADYEERAPYLIAAFCCEVGASDKEYRRANSLDEQPSFNPVNIALENDFPLDKRFYSAAIQYLASMLIIDENSELSDKLFERYCDSISAISLEIPSQTGSILDMYI